MKNLFRKGLVIFLALTMTLSLGASITFANDAAVTEETEQPVLNTLQGANVISGSFDSIEGYDIATIRYYDKDGNYEFADFEYNDSTGKYNYSFEAPYSGFTAVQGTEYVRGEEVTGCNVIAEYFSTTVWDGAIDVSWYDPDEDEYYIYTAAQLAGVAAICDGSVDVETKPYDIKGERVSEAEMKDGYQCFYDDSNMPDSGYFYFYGMKYIQFRFLKNAPLIATATGDCYYGLAEFDFADKTITIMNDLEMGGTSGDNITKEQFKESYEVTDSITGKTKTEEDWHNNLDYPNWMPMGGVFPWDVSNGDRIVSAKFNGVLDGGGHNINNIYCYRYSYKTCGDTAFGYCQGVGLIGYLGSLYDGEEAPTVSSAVMNLSLSGFIFGRRMVGGIVGACGSGGSATTGDPVHGVKILNVANHCKVLGTDSKGTAGIVGRGNTNGAIINCYNTGYVSNTEYACGQGGIVGENEGMNIICCYNTGTVYSGSLCRGRGIGADTDGTDYQVTDSAYLEGTGDCVHETGYWISDDPDTAAAKAKTNKVTVDITEMTKTQMTDGTLLNMLNVNGKAYVAGEDGYPILLWEAEDDPGYSNITVKQSEGGVITATQTEKIKNGTVVLLSEEAQTGYKFRYYTKDGNKLTGYYVTVDGNNVISAYFEPVVAGAIKIPENSIVDITVTKNGTVIESGTAKTVEDYPVNSGDPVYEGDTIIVKAAVKEDAAPDNPDLMYSDLAGLAKAFDYKFTYATEDDTLSTVTTQEITYVVDGTINEDGAALTLEVTPLTTQKLWRYSIYDTSWYNDTDTEFTLTTARQLAGLAVLVNGGNSFAGKTIKLGNDISLKNDDGTAGNRYWDGIGNSSDTPFAGNFDGQGHKITDILGSANGLFGYIFGSESSLAVIKNVSLYGTMTGSNASGLAAYTKYAEISGINVYCTISSGGGKTGGIVGYAGNGNTTTTITNCVNYGCVSLASGGQDLYIGGICGQTGTKTTITNCINKGNITAKSTGGNYVGGIVGGLIGTVEKCGNYGDVLASGRNLGGIAGACTSSNSVIRNSYNVGNVTLQDSTNALDRVGGIMGYASYYTAENCFSIGTVSTSGTCVTTKIGAFAGEEAERQKNTTTAVVILGNNNTIIENNTALKDLDMSLTYTKGISVAATSDFASTDGVIKTINSDNAFVLNGSYPEIGMASQTHVHSGGSATCTYLAKCDECGLEYGRLNPSVHGEKIVINSSEAHWNINGYTGDTICADCRKVLEKGTSIKAITGKTALSFTVMQNGEEVVNKDYTIAEFDALKTKGVVGYEWGGSMDEMMAATEYVTLETLMNEWELNWDDIETVIITASGNRDTITKEMLDTMTYFYESDGTATKVPFAFGITFTSGTGTLEEVSKEVNTPGYIRLGYGLNDYQWKNGAGGKRCVSPVDGCIVVLKDSEGAVIRKHVASEPTCTKDGNTVYYSCSETGKYYSDAEGKNEIEKDSWVIPATGHSITKHDAVAAACTTFGNNEYYSCEKCGEYFSDSEGKNEIEKDSWIIPALGHTELPAVRENEVKETCTTDGSYELVVYCKICGAEISRKKVTVPATGHSYNENGVCTVCGDKKEPEETDVFPDISECSDGVKSAIKWASEQGIVNGNKDGTFAPTAFCTRQQMVIMLWRLAGKPEPKSLDSVLKFTDTSDLSAGSKKAIAWAVEEGIISGYSDGTFRPTADVTRQQTVIMLWRLAGKPAATATSTFTDTDSCSAGAMKAINWAASIGITKGSANGDGTYRFAPNDSCQRQHIATFVYRYASKVK